MLLVTAITWGNSLYIHAKAKLAQILIADAWQDVLIKGDKTRPWSWADTWPVARVVTDKLEEDLYVLAGAHGSSLAFGPGHVDGTVLPGEPGLSVIAGHRDTHFSFLSELNPGDSVQLQTRRGEWHEFGVVAIEVVDTEVTAALTVDLNVDRLYLVTCYPFDALEAGGPLRYVVILERWGERSDPGA